MEVLLILLVVQVVQAVQLVFLAAAVQELGKQATQGLALTTVAVVVVQEELQFNATVQTYLGQVDTALMRERLRDRTGIQAH